MGIRAVGGIQDAAQVEQGKMGKVVEGNSPVGAERGKGSQLVAGDKGLVLGKSLDWDMLRNLGILEEEVPQ